MEPKEFIKAIEEYLTKNEIDIDTVTADNIDCENYEQLLWGNDIFDFRFGATRGCFIPAYNPSFVLKFDFDGLWEEYCAAERGFYKEACAQGLQKCFTKTYKFDYISNTPMYYCEYASTPFAHDRYLSEAERETVTSHTSKFGGPKIPLTWAKDFIDYHGAETFDKFLQFLISHGINDFHDNNIGYIGDRPVVFDYAGFFEPSKDC